jgi:UPF0716 protein FxsA
MYLLVAFLAVPLIEIALFIQIGGLIGLWPTLIVVILTAILGTYLVRSQGLRALERLRASFSELRDPSEPLADGAMILVAGALLLTPGFFTDAVGFALLTPPVRMAVFRYLRARVKVARFEMGPRPGPGHEPRPGPRRPQTTGGTIIEGEYEEVEPRPSKGGPRSPSGWTDPD